MTEKQGNKIPRQPMPEQPANERRHNFKEVPLGYTEEQALKEASRCLQCINPRCVAGCPVNVNIPSFISRLARGEFEAAYETLVKDNSLPAVCGRVCPQESQCESLCVLSVKGQSVAIGRLERYTADRAAQSQPQSSQNIQKPAGPKIAIIGSGPSGLACANELLDHGFNVTIFEALHRPGGVLVYGIPEFRLPKSIVAREISGLEAKGAEIRLDIVIGRLYNIGELLQEEGYSAVFIGSGAGYPKFLNIPGESLNGVYSSNEFLTRVNLMKAYDPASSTPVLKGKKIAVFGAGNTAMDSARTALRLGFEEVRIIYRRSREEMPARAEEIQHAEEEGVIFELLSNPLQFSGSDSGWLKSVTCQRMELGEPDASGRRRPIAVPNSEYEIEIDTAIVALGTEANPLLRQTTPGLACNKWGYIEADEMGRTSLKSVYAGGDIVTGAATVIKAMGAGKKAAQAIIEDMK